MINFTTSLNNILNLLTILPSQINENYVNFIDFRMILKLILLNYLMYKLIINFIYYPVMILVVIISLSLLFLHKKYKDYHDKKRNFHMLNSRKC